MYKVDQILSLNQKNGLMKLTILQVLSLQCYNGVVSDFYNTWYQKRITSIYS